MLTKSELVGADGLPWLSSVATNCFMVSMRIESSVDSVLGVEVRVRVGVEAALL